MATTLRLVTSETATTGQGEQARFVLRRDTGRNSGRYCVWNTVADERASCWSRDRAYIERQVIATAAWYDAATAAGNL